MECVEDSVAARSSKSVPRRRSKLDRAFIVETAARFDVAPLAHAGDLQLRLVPTISPRQSVIRLGFHGKHLAWVDSTLRVTWNITADELRAVAGSGYFSRMAVIVHIGEVGTNPRDVSAARRRWCMRRSKGWSESW